MRLKKRKKPILYAQEGTHVPSETEDPNQTTSRPLSYSDVYGETAYMGLGEGEGGPITKEESIGYLPDIKYQVGDSPYTGYGSKYSLFQAEGTAEGPSKSRLGFGSGFDQYANLYNIINKDYRGPRRGTQSGDTMTADSLYNMYQNPGELFKTVMETGNFRDMYQEPKSGGGKEDEYKHRMSFEDMKILDPSGEAFKAPSGRGVFLGSGNTIVLNTDGSFSHVQDETGTSMGVSYTDEQKKDMETFLKNKALQNYVTHGMPSGELEKYRRGGGDIEPIGLTKMESPQKKLELGDLERQVPSFIEDKSGMGEWNQEEINALNIGETDDDDKKGYDWDKMYTFIGDEGDEGGEEGPGGDDSGDTTTTTTPVKPIKGKGKGEGGGEEKEVVVEDEGFSIGGNDYGSESEAKAALKKKPQSQLSDEEYDFLFSSTPATQKGKNGMRLNKYKKGGITLKKKK